VGSGVPQVKFAYAMHSGRVPFRDAVGKFILGIVQISSGASLGREGPTVQICAGISSLLARVSSLSRQSQRRMAAVGVAAGIAAAFNAPIAAVTFTLEEIIGDLDQTMLSGVIVAAAIAAAVERGILGQHPVFEIQRTYTLGHASSLVSYVVLGVLSAIISVAFTDSLLGLRARFKQLTSLPKWVHPAIGGGLTGALAVLGLLWLKQDGITGGGYPTLALALTGSLPVKVLLGLCLLKFAATICSYSSGGCGGIFAPALFVGGMLGGTVGHLDVLAFHHSSDSIGAFALVGMGAVFAGIIRAPMTSVLIIFEMTGSYGLILPLMIANMSAYALARHWRHLPIYEALLLQDGIVLPHGKPVSTDESALPGEVPP
jgi:CIC family chloride channel protein